MVLGYTFTIELLENIDSEDIQTVLESWWNESVLSGLMKYHGGINFLTEKEYNLDSLKKTNDETDVVVVYKLINEEIPISLKIVGIFFPTIKEDSFENCINRDDLQELEKILPKECGYPHCLCKERFSGMDYNNVVVFSEETWDDLSNSLPYAVPTRNHPRIVEIVKKRLCLLERIEKIFSKDLLENLKSSPDSSTCVCYSGDTSGKCINLRACLNSCLSSLGNLLSDGGPFFTSPLFTEQGRREDIIGFTWTVVLMYERPDIGSKMARLEATFQFAKISLYSWREYDVLNCLCCNGNLLDLLEPSYLSDPEFSFENHLSIGKCTVEESELLSDATFNHSSIDVPRYFDETWKRSNWYDGRQRARVVFGVPTLKLEGLELEPSSIYSYNKPGMVYINYTIFPVLCALFCHKLILKRLHGFQAKILKESLESCIPLDVLKGELIHTNASIVRPFGNRMANKGIILSREPFEMDSSFSDGVKSQFPLHLSKAMDKIHPHFYESVYCNFSSELLGNHPRKVKTTLRVHQLRGFSSGDGPGSRRSSNLENHKDITEMLEYITDDNLEDYDETKEQEFISDIYQPVQDSSGYKDSDSETRKLAYKENLSKLSSDEPLLLGPPCFNSLLSKLKSEQRHPNFDERFFLVSSMVDMGLRPLEIASVYKTLFFNVNLGSTVKSFLRDNKQYGKDFVGMLKNLYNDRMSVRYNDKEENQNTVDGYSTHTIYNTKPVGWGCCKTIKKGFCTSISLVTDIEDLADEIQSTFDSGTSYENSIECRCDSRTPVRHSNARKFCSVLATELKKQTLEKLTGLKIEELEGKLSCEEITYFPRISSPLSFYNYLSTIDYGILTQAAVTQLEDDIIMDYH